MRGTFQIRGLILCALIAPCGCGQPGEVTVADEVLAKRLTAATNTTRNATIDFTWVAPRDWDRLFIFAPYTTRREIDERLGFSWVHTSTTRVSASEDVALLVFVKDKKVTRWLDFPRERADFSFVASSKGYTPSDARFAVRHDRVWPSVELVSRDVRNRS